MSWKEFESIRNKHPRLRDEFDVVERVIRGSGKGSALSDQSLADVHGLDAGRVSFVLEALATGNALERTKVLTCRCGEILPAESQESGAKCPVCEVDLSEHLPSSTTRFVSRLSGDPMPASKRIAETRADEAEIGVITALPKEGAAVLSVSTDRLHVSRGAGAQLRTYDVCSFPGLGGEHSVIHTTLTGAGTNSAATRAAVLVERFQRLKHIIMVGIAGAVPNPDDAEEHVRLGDIVVSDQSGVTQYDLGKREADGFTVRSHSNPPAAQLIDGVNRVRTQECAGERPWAQHIARSTLVGYARPDEREDVLHSTADQALVIAHPPDAARRNGEPRIFYGPIASANTLLRDPELRDWLRDQHGVKAVEMEASGIADATWQGGSGYLVIRGACDYCDTHKNDTWQSYAALAAAAYLRGLLSELAPPG